MSIDWISRSKEAALKVHNLIGGCCSAGSGKTVDKRSPRDGRALYGFGGADKRDVGEAVTNARLAFEDGRWSTIGVQHRKNVLHRLATLLEEHREELALLECLDVGKPISDALNGDVPAAAAILRFNAEAADKFYGSVFCADRANLSYQLHRPIGVVGGIVGWNFPLVLAAAKVGPVLAAGNCLILKPSELTSLSAVRLGELALEAGVPEGVLNVVNGDPSVGAELAHHHDVDLVTFTGSTHTGKKLLVASGQSNMKRLVLECGGKTPNIVFADCPDLNAVAGAVVRRAFWNQGQVCTASSRLLVQEEIKDQLLKLIVEKTAAMQIGDPLKSETKFGALVSEAHRQKVLNYIAGAEKSSARLLYRSVSPAPVQGGYYIPPVIFDHVLPDQPIAREEIFGPVLSVISFREEEDAVRIANGTIYGLSAILWTKDIGRAHRMSQKIKAGWIIVNATVSPVAGIGEGVVPLGGHKESGLGVEGGLEGLECYVSKTAVQVFV
jgi:acyl-CoA reductase-like NAD-dependent aldehyde dehydrogenase